ncbi:MAG TPA: RsmD family RNA methyltransferase [Mesotoga sp.]|nr:RsmD family RNA methyltransferase [Mesotoga sp.]
MTLTGGEWSRRRIEVTEREVTRYTPQTARKAIFDIIDVEGKSFLDPFSGSGVMVFEALSRRAERATAIDVSRTACKTIRRNMDRLDPSMKLDILCGDFRRMLPLLAARGERFDFVFADPPFDRNYMPPFLKSLLENRSILNRGSLIIVETSEEESLFAGREEMGFLKMKDRRNYANVVFTFLVMTDEVPR